jgi:acetyl-CoA carboxylase biotin carboxyl carrier protein
MNSKNKDRLVDEDVIRGLAELLNDTGLSEIEVEQHGLRIRIARNLTVSAAVAAPAGYAPAATPHNTAAAAPAHDENHPGTLKSPMVGTVYRSPEPGAATFVEVGSSVKQGQTVLIIEAMKTMNHIPAPRAGTVKAILVENEQPVEYGEALMIIE